MGLTRAEAAPHRRLTRGGAGTSESPSVGKLALSRAKGGLGRAPLGPPANRFATGKRIKLLQGPLHGADACRSSTAPPTHKGGRWHF